MIKNQPGWQNLIEQLSRASDEDAVEAAKSLSYQSHKDCIRALTQFARSEQPPLRKELALYALAWMHNPQLIDTFIQVLKDTNEIENDELPALTLLKGGFLRPPQ